MQTFKDCLLVTLKQYGVKIMLKNKLFSVNYSLSSHVNS